MRGAPEGWVFLVGMPGAGKTTVAREVAARMGRRCLDLDDVIVAREAVDIPAIFAERGEDGFRRAERAALASTLAGEQVAVLACGGGTPCFGDNLERMRARGTVVYLRASLDTLVTRTAATAGAEGPDGRPLLAGDPGARLRELLARRAHVYEQAAVCVDVDGLGPGAVADAVVAAVGGVSVTPDRAETD